MLAHSAEELKLEFSVSDTGIGIPAEKHDLVFEAFAQANGSTTRNFGGTGLGLSICSRLAGLMGGRIWLDSAPGQGSTFHFTVSLGVAPEMPASLASEPLLAFHDVSVLVVDDNTASRRILVKTTEAWGMRPTAVASGTAALDAIKKADANQSPFAIAIIDGRMPIMDGFYLRGEIVPWTGSRETKIFSRS
jgi:hypothetical protein